jgi:hypothetical protein
MQGEHPVNIPDARLLMQLRKRNTRVSVFRLLSKSGFDGEGMV